MEGGGEGATATLFGRARLPTSMVGYPDMGAAGEGWEMDVGLRGVAFARTIRTTGRCDVEERRAYLVCMLTIETGETG